jgi:hypothetical protein
VPNDTEYTSLPRATTDLRIGVLMGRVDGLENRIAETDRAMNGRMDRFERSMTERFTTIEGKLDGIADSIYRTLGATSAGSFILRHGVAIGSLLVAATAVGLAIFHMH